MGLLCAILMWQQAWTYIYPLLGNFSGWKSAVGGCSGEVSLGSSGRHFLFSAAGVTVTYCMGIQCARWIRTVPLLGKTWAGELFVSAAGYRGILQSVYMTSVAAFSTTWNIDDFLRSNLLLTA